MKTPTRQFTAAGRGFRPNQTLSQRQWGVGSAILAESSLSFLGLGFPPDMPTWGRLLFDAKDHLDSAPPWSLYPGTMIFSSCCLSTMWVMAGAMRWMPGRCCSGAAWWLPRCSAASLSASLCSEEAGLLCCFFEGLPSRSNARYKGIAPLTCEHSLAGRILGIDGDKRLGNPLHEFRVHVAMGCEAAVAITRTGPDKP